MKSIYITDLQKGLLINGETFLIISCDKAEDKYGKSYYKVTIGDKTGRVEGKLWSDALIKTDEKILKSGNIVKIDAKVEEYRGMFQMNILSMEKVDQDKLDDFLESSIFDANEMFAEVNEAIGAVKNVEIKKILTKILTDEDIKKRFMYWPAASVVHHNFRSGLLQHVVEMLNIGNSLKRFYPEADFDLLTAGILLHDIGKVYELDGNDLAVPYSKQGLLIGHINISLRIFEDFGGRELPEDIYLHIAHLILSHHGTYEFGSPVLPSSVEAIMLTYIDDLSAKSRTADSARQRIPENESFSPRIMWLENAKIWKGVPPNLPTELDIPENVSDISDIAEQLEF